MHMVHSQQGLATPSGLSYCADSNQMMVVGGLSVDFFVRKLVEKEHAQTAHWLASMYMFNLCLT